MHQQHLIWTRGTFAAVVEGFEGGREFNQIVFFQGHPLQPNCNVLTLLTLVLDNKFSQGKGVEDPETQEVLTGLLDRDGGALPLAPFASYDSTVDLFPFVRSAILATGRSTYMGSAHVDFSLEKLGRPLHSPHGRRSRSR